MRQEDYNFEAIIVYMERLLLEKPEKRTKVYEVLHRVYLLNMLAALG